MIFTAALLVVMLVVLLANRNVVAAAVGSSPIDIPNPLTNPVKCGRPSVTKSSICDIDNMMTSEDKDVIEGYINKIEDDEIAVLVIKKMAATYIGYNSIERASERFARQVHDNWGVGRVGEDNGALIFLAVDDRAVFISVGKGEQEKLNNGVLDALISKMKAPLRSGQYGKAVEQTVVSIQLLLSSEEARKSYGSRSGISSIELTIIAVLSFVFCGIWVWGMYEARQMQSMRNGRAALDKLMREVRLEQDFAASNGSAGSSNGSAGSSNGSAGSSSSSSAVDSNGNPVFLSQSCPICLEDFPCPSTAHAAETTEATPQLDPRRPMALQCGHTFCHECLDDFLRQRTGDACPVCRCPLGRPSHPHPTPSPRHTSPPPNTGLTGLRPPDSYFGGGSSCSHNYSSSSFFNQRQFLETRSMEHRYRLGRIRLRYPRLLDVEAARVIDSSLADYGSGSIGTNVFLQALESRSAEVSRIVSSYDARQAAAASGSSGAKRSSFGGGRSSGGRGGRW